MARCRDCKLYDLETVKSKSGAVLRGRVAKCLWESTEVYPASVPTWRSPRPTPSYMEPYNGQDCQCFVPLTTPKEQNND